MKFLASILFLLLTLQSIAQPPADSLNKVDANGLRQGHWVITGAMKKDSAYAPDAKAEEGNYVDGHKEGKWIAYFPNGAVKSKIQYTKNRPTGRYVKYYSSPHTLLEEGTWKGNGRHIGIQKMYYPNGNIRTQLNFDTSGRRGGLQYWYDDRGQLAISVMYDNGIQHGWKKTYYANGLLKSEEYYNLGRIDPARTVLYPKNDPDYLLATTINDSATNQNGTCPPNCEDCECRDGRIINGVFRIYDSYGILQGTTVYKDGHIVNDSVFANTSDWLDNDTVNRIDAAGKRQGYWIYTAKMKNNLQYYVGYKVEEGRYIDNRKTGLWIEYYPNGNKRSEVIYANGRPNGFCILYYENGYVKQTGTWKGSRWTGVYKEYFESGILRDSSAFDTLGKRHGERRIYYDTGILMMCVHYDHGRESGWVREYWSNGLIKNEKYYNTHSVDSVRDFPGNAPPEYDPIRPAYMPVKPVPQEGRGNCVDCEWSNHKLINGNYYVYNTDGLLLRIEVYKDGKYTGDAPLE